MQMKGSKGGASQILIEMGLLLHKKAEKTLHENNSCIAIFHEKWYATPGKRMRLRVGQP